MQSCWVELFEEDSIQGLVESQQGKCLSIDLMSSLTAVGWLSLASYLRENFRLPQYPSQGLLPLLQIICINTINPHHKCFSDFNQLGAVHREFEVKAGVMLGTGDVKSKSAPNSSGFQKELCVLSLFCGLSGGSSRFTIPSALSGAPASQMRLKGQVVNISRFVDLCCSYLTTTVTAIKDACGSFPIQFYLQNSGANSWNSMMSALF